MSENRIIELGDRLARAADARHMATTHVWADAWTSFERELFERLLKLGPTDDEARYRLQIGIEAARHVKRAIEHEGKTEASLRKELDLLTGAKPRAVA